MNPTPKGLLIKITNLGSGSKGNSTLITHKTSSLLIDCGFSARQTTHRLSSLPIPPTSITAILLTHEHTDHINGAPTFSRQTNTPIFATQGTLNGAKLTSPQILRYNTPITHNDFTITPIPVSHDTHEPCAYLIEVAGTRALFATDLGTTEGLDISNLCDLDYLYIEANHDESMLRNGPYPAFLKQRIAGNKGHLNNQQCGEFIKSLAHQSPNLKAIMLAHLSDKNNTPQAALNTAREFAGALPDTQWVIAQQAEPVELA